MSEAEFGIIDLRSDTLSKPTAEMRRIICDAEVGDDCYGEDRNVRALEDYCAKLLGKEQALFMASGTMSNQVALRCHCQPGDEVVLDSKYHICYFEAAQTGDLARVVLTCCETDTGIPTIEDIEAALGRKPRGPYYTKPKLLCVENTVSATGGRVVSLRHVQELYGYAHDKNLAVHIDGARLLNASVAAGVVPKRYAACADSVSLCFAKGLGAPFGSVLAGTADFIGVARKYRKWYGGALHQSGMMASAALFALQNHTQRLAEDHEHARLLAQLLTINGLEVVFDCCNTNFVMFKVGRLGLTPQQFVELARTCGVLLFPWTDGMVRAMTYLDISLEQVYEAGRRLGDLVRHLSGRRPGHTSTLPAPGLQGALFRLSA